MTKTVYIHANGGGGTYQGNGGFVCLNELGFRLGQMGYQPVWFDHLDRLRPAMWDWVGYPAPEIAAFADVLADTAPLVTTWLHCWLDVLTATPDLWPRLRYWCSGELLRDETIHDAGRQFARDHLQTIAINNPTLAAAYQGIGVSPRWFWTNWIRDEFQSNPAVRQRGRIGYQPDGDKSDVYAALVAAFGENALIECAGTQLEVAQKMQQCDLFLAWNRHWPLICGLGESFGLSTYEAMACGCVVVTRAHVGNKHLEGTVVRAETLDDAICSLRVYQEDKANRGNVRHAQTQKIERAYRFDDMRQAMIVAYIEGIDGIMVMHRV